jgi:hypothetical protein
MPSNLALKVRPPWALGPVLTLGGFALMIMAYSLLAYNLHDRGFSSSSRGFALIAVFLLITSYAFLSLASDLWFVYDYIIEKEGNHLVFVKVGQHRCEELYRIQIAAVESIGFAFGRPKPRSIGDWRINAPMVLLERGVLVSFTTLGQPRQYLIRMSGLTRRKAKDFEKHLKAWVLVEQLPLRVESFTRIPINEDRLELS